MKKSLALSLVVLSAVFFAACTGRSTTVGTPVPSQTPASATAEPTGAEVDAAATPGTTGDENDTAGSSMKASVQEFVVEGGNMKFTPNTLTVKQGDTVRITFKNTGGVHDFVLDEFNVKTQQIVAGEQEVVEFVANKKGSFEYYCSVANHRQQGMVGTLVVE